MKRVAYLLFVLLPLPLLAQVESVKFRLGDGAHWAEPNYDDSAWRIQDDPLATWSWARYKIRIPDRVDQSPSGPGH